MTHLTWEGDPVPRGQGDSEGAADHLGDELQLRVLVSGDKNRYEALLRRVAIRNV